MMSSGLDYEESGWFLFNGDDPLTTYHPDQRAGAQEHPDRRAARQDVQLQQVPPQLLGTSSSGRPGCRSPPTPSRGVDPLGMEFDGAWTLDSEASGFEKMEAGLNARAVDFAKLGRLFLHEGAGKRPRSCRPSGWRRRPASNPPIAPGACPEAGPTGSCGGASSAPPARLTSTPQGIRPVRLRVATGSWRHRPDRCRVRRIVLANGSARSRGLRMACDPNQAMLSEAADADRRQVWLRGCPEPDMYSASPCRPAPPRGRAGRSRSRRSRPTGRRCADGLTAAGAARG